MPRRQLKIVQQFQQAQTLGQLVYFLLGNIECSLQKSSQLNEELVKVKRNTMPLSLHQIDTGYLNRLKEVTKQLTDTYGSLLTNYHFDLTQTEISEAVIERLKTYYITQREIKQLLDKGYLAPASDFFVESVLFYLQIYLKQHKPKLTVKSEKDILIRKYIDKDGKNKREVIRPDISIFKDDSVIAIIECKTQLGWNRHKWEIDFIDRKNKLLSKFSTAKAYLLVMTGDNWSGFENNIKKGTEYFCLLEDIWPTDYTDSSQIMTSIESLFQMLTDK